MDDILTRLWQEIVERPTGPLALRFYIQPLMAVGLAARDGVRDARAGRPPYLWSVLTDPAHRRESLRAGWRSIGKVFVLALVLDLAYQLFVLKGLRPVQGLLVAIVLAIVPYALLRGPVNRVFRRASRIGRPRERAA
jgi:hypothetical protein